MRTFLIMWLAIATSFALPPGVTGLKIYQYPNNPNPPLNVLVLIDPGNGNYNNSTLLQIANVLASSGVFSNGIVLTVITNTTFVSQNSFITNLTLVAPGGFTNQNLTPNTLMWANAFDVESSIPNAQQVLTNDGSGGIGWSLYLSLTEVDAVNFYPTNLFTLITNAPVLATDGNGKLISSDFTAPTNYAFQVVGVGNTNNALALSNNIMSNLRYPTNTSGTTVLGWSTAYRTNLSHNVTLTFASAGAAFYETGVFWTTNSSGSDFTTTWPAGCIGPVGSGTPPVLTSTNKTITRYIYEHLGPSDFTVSKTDFGN